MTTYLRGLLEGWESLDTGDMFHILGMGDLPAIESMTGVVERLAGRGQVARVWAQQSRVPRLAR
ncbi:MAG: hypothetical protein GEU80_07720 [Dehalococcoidia bacterium]|nr:hypothetical protein [Dehalococcoidia bacterium]